jgi:hypothetical protein
MSCSKDELMKDICQKYANFIGKNIDSLRFSYDEKEINFQLSFEKLVNEKDKEKNEMKIFVYNDEDNQYKCPKCGEKLKFNKIDKISSSMNNLKDSIDGIKLNINNIIKTSSDNSVNIQLKNINIILNGLNDDIKKINEEINDKNFNNENYLRDILSLNNAINESNQTIQKLKLRIQKKIDEEEKRKNIIIEKENEIELLKKFIENLKFQNNNNEQMLQNQILKATEENKQLNNLLQSATKQKIDEEDLSNVKPELNDLEEDNLKELAGLMKKVLEE